MERATTASAFLRRLHPWLGKAVHTRWSMRRSFYQREVDALLIALQVHDGRLPPDLKLRLEGLLGRLYREWFPSTWRKEPTYAEVIADFRWWLGVAERWGEPPPRPPRARRGRDPLANQPEHLLRMLALPPECTPPRLLSAWRRLLKPNPPDVDPHHTP